MLVNAAAITTQVPRGLSGVSMNWEGDGRQSYSKIQIFRVGERARILKGEIGSGGLVLQRPATPIVA